MRILITGVCGFVGSTLAEYLLDRVEGIRMVGMDNLIRPGAETNRRRIERLGVKFIHGDLRSASDVAGLPGLWAVVRQAKMQVDRCRMMTLPEPGRMGKVIAEHEAILDALAAGDAAKAAACLDAHLSRVLIDADALSQLHPDYFLLPGTHT